MPTVRGDGQQYLTSPEITNNEDALPGVDVLLTASESDLEQMIPNNPPFDDALDRLTLLYGPAHPGIELLEGSVRIDCPVGCALAVRFRGADPNAPLRDGHMATHIAAHAGNTRALTALIQLGADVTLVSPMHIGGPLDSDFCTALHVAAACGHVSTSEAVISHAPSLIWAVDDYGSTALLWAARGGHIDICRLILDAGTAAEVDAGTAPVAAAAGTSEAVVSVAATSEVGDVITGISPTATNRTPLGRIVPAHLNSSLAAAASAGHAAVCALLIAHGASAGARDADGRTALHAAPDAATVDALVSPRGDSHDPPIDLNAADAEGATPLHTAAARGDVSALTSFLAYGADPRTRASGRGGGTPLHEAAAGGHAAAVAALVRGGAPVCAADEDGATALHAAAAGGDKMVVAALLGAVGTRRLGQPPSARPRRSAVVADDCGSTIATGGLSATGDGACGDVDAGRMAVLLAADASGATAAHVAAREGHADVLVALIAFAQGLGVDDGDSCHADGRRSEDGDGSGDAGDVYHRDAGLGHAFGDGGHTLADAAAEANAVVAAEADADAVADAASAVLALVSAVDVGGDTPLHLASRGGHADAVGVLVAAGADMYVLNERGEGACDGVAVGVDGYGEYGVDAGGMQGAALYDLGDGVFDGYVGRYGSGYVGGYGDVYGVYGSGAAPFDPQSGPGDW